MTDLVLEDKPAHGSPEWLAARHRDRYGRARLTASVAGVLFDCHPFISPGDLAVQMLRDEPPDAKTSAAMRRGTALEPVLVAQWAFEKHQEIDLPSSMFVRDRWLANLDAVCWDWVCPVEAKTTAGWFTGELPEYWRWQGVAQRWCFAGQPGPVAWSILDSDLEFKFHDQFVESAEMDQLLLAGGEWLSYIDNGMPPLHVDLTARHIASLNPHRTGAVELGRDGALLVRRRQRALAAEKAAHDEAEMLKDEIAAELAGRDVGLYDGEEIVTWHEQPGRRSFDQSAFRAEHPDLFDKFTRVGEPFRTMRLKGDPDD